MGDVTIHHEIHGEGLPILLVHGFTPDHRLMTGCMEPIFQRRPGWQRIYPDLPGMGRTPASPTIRCTDDMLDALDGFVEAAIGSRPFAVVGQSYGGLLARGLVARRREQLLGVALLCPVVQAERERRALPPFVVLADDPALMASLSPADREEFGSMAVVQSPATWERFRDEVLPGLKVADQPFLQRIGQRYGFSFDVDALPRPFERPTLILMGRQDHIVGWADAMSLMPQYPRATLAVLDRAGHNLQFEQEPLFEGLMEEWMDRVEESVGAGA
jgi:pimeloyl-ACP methyl ester carboxylesterase